MTYYVLCHNYRGYYTGHEYDRTTGKTHARFKWSLLANDTRIARYDSEAMANHVCTNLRRQLNTTRIIVQEVD